MNARQLVWRSLCFHWRIHGAVALGVAAATAVLTGALLVGDAVRGSLRSLTLDRLGRIDGVLVSDRFFRADAVRELSADPLFQRSFELAVPAILFPEATVEAQVDGAAVRASSVLAIGCDASFWDLDTSGVRPARLPGPGQVVINQAVADDWGARVGDRIVVRFPQPNQVPADSPLAKKTDRIRSLPQLEIVAIVPTRGLGGFRLRPSQGIARNLFLPIESLQDALEQPDRINAAMVALQPAWSPLGPEAKQAYVDLAKIWKPTFEDYGLTVKRVQRTYQPKGSETAETVFDYFSITTDRMIFSPAATRVATRAFAPFDAQPLFTYLANALERVGGPTDPPLLVPYSTVTAIDFSPQFSLIDLAGQPIPPLGPSEIVLNRWTAEELKAQVGDTIRLSYFAPETTHGQAVEQQTEFVVKAVARLTQPSQPYARRRAALFTERPELANDPDLTPEVAGVTDQETIDDWDPPFPFDRSRIRRQDDDYWGYFRTTPKAFVALQAGQTLWQSRFGNVTAFRVPAREGLTEEQLKTAFLTELRTTGETLGMEFIPVKRRQLEASRGTTPFDGLFLALSFFIIAAALLLVSLLFRLGVEQRAEQIGILLATGLRRQLVGRLLASEGAVIAALGGLLGVAIGIAYAWLMVSGLRTWWVGAITTPFLEFHWSARSLVVGYLLGVLVCIGTILWSIRQTRGLAVRQLLSGVAVSSPSGLYKPDRWSRLASLLCFVLAIGLSLLATRLGGMPQAGCFVGGGAMLLTGLLLRIGVWLKAGGGRRRSELAGRYALFKLALKNAARNPSRSAVTIGLMATASFLIVAMSAFRVAPTSAGSGGFDLVAQSAQPIFQDLNTPAGRLDLLGDQLEALQGSQIYALRLKSGDDASCNNLYQPTQPRVLGLTPQLIARFDDPAVTSFTWAGTAARTTEERANPWRLLEPSVAAGGASTTDFGEAVSSNAEEPIPVILDMSTALYSLKPPLSVGSIYEATYDDGEPKRFRVVGLLENSLLQGSLLIAESAFERAFPEVSGYRYFLLSTPSQQVSAVTSLLEDRLGDQGFDVEPAASVLTQLLAVQNTYLSTFQSLGALGLLLGTFGVATVQLRSVVERRGELALLRAAGYRRKRIGRMVLWENIVLLLGGLATGTLAATVAVLPHKLLGTSAFTMHTLGDLTGMLVAVLVVGIVTGLIAVRAALATPVLQALRDR